MTYNNCISFRPLCHNNTRDAGNIQTVYLGNYGEILDIRTSQSQKIGWTKDYQIPIAIRGKKTGQPQLPENVPPPRLALLNPYHNTQTP